MSNYQLMYFFNLIFVYFIKINLRYSLNFLLDQFVKGQNYNPLKQKNLQIYQQSKTIISQAIIFIITIRTMKETKAYLNETTYSQKRAKQLLQRSQKVAKLFNINNFYDNNHINVEKLRDRIIEAKKKLLQDKQKDLQKQKERKRQQQKSIQKELQKSRSKQKQLFSANKILKNKSLLKTQHDLGQYRNMALFQQKTKRRFSRAIQHRQQKSRIHKNQKIARIATDMGDYHLDKRYQQNPNLSRLKSLNNNQTISKFRTVVNTQQGNHLRTSSVDTPTGFNTKTIPTYQIQHKKIIINELQQLKLFEIKISVLWQLYQTIVSLMQQAAKSPNINQKLVTEYINHVSSQKFEFIHQIYQIFSDMRVQRTIRLSRILQNFSIFQMCLNSVVKTKGNSTQIINYLGFSSSSVVFIIKILLLTHETELPFSLHVANIVESILKFQANSYKSQLKNVKQVLRRLEHNNQIIGMIKTRCGKKHGKYCQQFIVKMIKSIEKFRTPFYQCANNIFQFLAFYLHHQNLAQHLPILSTPPSPFLSLAYSKTIIIDPWGVLAYKKNNKLVIRAHTGKFLAQISDSCNIIFWTQLMPKDADILTNLFPVKQNIYWLYKYHCRQTSQYLVKLIDLVGCITENTIVIDSDPDHYSYNNDIGIIMPWRGEKKDTKLLNLSQILQHIFAQSHKNKTTLKDELKIMRPQIQQINIKKKRHLKYGKG